MSANTPPNPYFNGINFNSSFFSTISNYLTQAIADSRYLRLIGGTLSGFLGIKIIPRVELDINGQAIINTGTYTIPSNGTYGSAGTRLILKEGSSNATPMALGADTNAITYGTPSGSEHNFYTGTNKQVIINSSGIIINNSPSSGSGFLTLYGGGAGNLGGLVGFYNSSGTRLGYVGWNDGLNNILLQCESTTTGYRIFNNGATSANLIVDGKVGIGTTGNLNGNLTSYSTNTALPRITLTGTEFYQPGGPFSSTDGAALMLGLNRSTVKGIFLCDTSLLAQNSNNPMIKFAIYNNPSSCAIDASATDGLTKLPLTICGSTTFTTNGTVGIGTATANSTLDVNGNITARNYSGSYGYSKLVSANSTNPGYVEFWNSSSIRAGYIGFSDANNYLYLASENGYLGYRISGNLALGGPITTLLNNWDMQIYQNNANTTGGNINIITYGNGGSINLITNNLSRLTINPQGYIVNNTGAFSTLMAAYTPAITGTSGYWLIPIPYLVNGNYYNMGMLNVYNSDNGSWWAGHIVVNTSASSVAYTTVANGGYIQLNSALQTNGAGTICIKIGFSNGFNITNANYLYFKYIG